MFISRPVFFLLALSVGGLPLALGADRSPARWEKDILAFEQSDRTNPPPRGAVLFVGSSTIRLWTNLARSFPTFPTIQRGFGGSHLTDLNAFADRIVFPYVPAQIVVYAGENDVARGDSPEMVRAEWLDFVKKVRKRLPNAQIYFTSMKPSPKRWHLAPQIREANRLIRNECREKDLTFFVDVWPLLVNTEGVPEKSLFSGDDLHLNDRGYRRLAEQINTALAQNNRCCE
jgi:hypothetical protein